VRNTNRDLAEALETHFPELMETQPEIFAQRYAEAGLVEKSVAFWGKAGDRSTARSAMAEAAAQFQKGLDQLALLSNNPERQRQELELGIGLAASLEAVKGQAAPETGDAYARARELWEQLGSPSEFPSGSLWPVSLSREPRRIRFGAAIGREFAPTKPPTQ
jgi:predicted ATPase